MLRVRLLAGGLAPAAFVIATRTSGHHLIWTGALAVVGIGAVVSVLLLLHGRSATEPQPYTLTRVQDESAQVPAYLLTYVFPFLFLTVSEWRDVIAYAIFVALLAVMVLRTNLILVNPILLVARYHLYAIEAGSGFEGLLLSTERPHPGQTIEAVHLEQAALKLVAIQP